MQNGANDVGYKHLLLLGPPVNALQSKKQSSKSLFKNLTRALTSIGFASSESELRSSILKAMLRAREKIFCVSKFSDVG
jgi:hypothetical protein